MKHALAILLVASLIVGCGTDSASSNDDPVPAALSADAKNLVGKWVGRPETSDEDIARMRETMSEEQIEALLSMIEEMEPTLELFEDGTYSMSNAMLQFPIKDTWTLDGDTLTLASSGVSFSRSGAAEDLSDFEGFKEEDMVPNKDPLNLSVESDGTELVMGDSTGEMTSRLVYTKE